MLQTAYVHIIVFSCILLQVPFLYVWLRIFLSSCIIHNTDILLQYPIFLYSTYLTMMYTNFDVFLTVHHTIDLFHLPTLMHNSFIH
jgi:hypothetical protein